MMRSLRRNGWTLGALVGATLLLGGLAGAQTPPAAPAASTATPPAPAPPAPTLPPLPVLCQPALPPGMEPPIPLDRPLALRDALALAMYEQPQIAISAGSAAATAARVTQVRSGLFPTASASASYSHARRQGSFGLSPNTYAASLSAQQLLYDFGRTSAEVTQARLLAQASAAGLTQTREDVVQQVKQAYYTLLEDQRLVDVQHANIADQQAHLELARARYEAGVAPRSDVITAETSVSSAIFDYVTAENAAAIARVNLNSAIGIDVRTPTLVADTDEPVPAQSTDLVAQALANRPDMAQARAALRASEEALRIARLSNSPEVVLTADYGLTGSNFPPDTHSWSYGVALQWPFFNVGLTSGRIAEAQANLSSSQAQLKQTAQIVGTDVMQAYLNMQAAEAHVTAAAAEVRNAEEEVSLATGRYQAGVAIYIEVIDAQSTLVTARTNQINAVYGLNIARAALARALGVEGF